MRREQQGKCDDNPKNPTDHARMIGRETSVAQETAGVVAHVDDHPEAFGKRDNRQNDRCLLFYADGCPPLGDGWNRDITTTESEAYG